jgi:hypothetical protein
MLRLLRQPGNVPGFRPVDFFPDAIAGGRQGVGNAGFGSGLTKFTQSLTRRPESSPCAKGTGLKSSLTLYLLFMTRQEPAP